MIVLTVAALTLQEAARRKVLRSLAVLTVLLLGLSAWGFSRIDAEFGGLTSGEAVIAAATVLNLVMFGLSLIAALGTAFLAGPTLAGDIESGTALAMLARPIHRASVLLGKWLGLVAFGGGFVVLAGLAQLVIVRVTTGYWPPHPVTGLALLAFQTVVLLALSAWGFSRLNAEFGGLTSGEARLAASMVLNLVMFGLSLIAALGTAFLAGPTVAGEIESGIALAVLARPVHRSAVLLGKWLGLVVFGSGFVILAGLAQFLIVRATVGYWPPQPVTGLALLAGQTTVLLTLALLLSTAISPMASGIVAVGLFGSTWVAGVVGGVGTALGNDSVERVGTVSRMLLPTDGLWRGAMNAFQDPSLLLQFSEAFKGHPFLSANPLSPAYIGWSAVWTALVLGLAGLSFHRRDL